MTKAQQLGVHSAASRGYTNYTSSGRGCCSGGRRYSCGGGEAAVFPAEVLAMVVVFNICEWNKIAYDHTFSVALFVIFIPWFSELNVLNNRTRCDVWDCWTGWLGKRVVNDLQHLGRWSLHGVLRVVKLQPRFKVRNISYLLALFHSGI